MLTAFRVLGWREERSLAPWSVSVYVTQVRRWGECKQWLCRGHLVSSEARRKCRSFALGDNRLRCRGELGSDVGFDPSVSNAVRNRPSQFQGWLLGRGEIDV